MAHPVIHFEILGQDANGLQGFYRSAFDWTIDANNPMNYGMVSPEDKGIGGGVGASMDGASMVTVYVEVDDLQSALDRITELGGQTVMPPMDVPGGPSIAQFTDPAGNRVGLVKGM
ncbi:MAG: VOC family protein [Actinomycetota bacterium]|nr:VOC family protein [Actinomycetota bacterium]MDQ6947060.1 VOC family protein [Actinomycetota bacterium]